MLNAFVQVVQDGARSANVYAAYPPDRRSSAENPHGHLYRVSACATSSTVARELVVSGVVGRVGSTVRPLPSESASPTRKETAGTAQRGDFSDAEEAPSGRADSENGHAPQPKNASTNTACVGVGSASVRVLTIGAGANTSNVALTAFVRNRSVPSVAALGEEGPECTADVHALICCDALSRLSWYLYRSCKEGAITELLNAVLSSSATWQTPPNGAWVDHTEVPGDAVPSFVRDWAFPLSPLFVALTQRLPRSSGASAAIAKCGRAIGKAGEKSIASVVDLAAVLDDRFGGAIVSCLKKIVPNAALLTGPAPPTTDHVVVHPVVDLKMATKDSRAAEDIRRREVTRHTLFTAVFSSSGLMQARGGFFSKLCHGERMIVACAALCCRKPSDEIQWSYTRQGKQVPVTLLVFRVSDGITYVAGVKTSRDKLNPTQLVTHFTTRLAVDKRTDTGAILQHLTRSGSVSKTSGGCCTSGTAIDFEDLSQICSTMPGLIAAHAELLEKAHAAESVLGYQVLSRNKGLPEGISTAEANAMFPGVESVRCTVQCCPSLHVAEARQLGSASMGPTCVIEQSPKTGAWSYTNREFEVKPQSEWALRPDPECSFVVGTGAAVAGSLHHHVPLATLAHLPANCKVPYRRRCDVTNSAEAPQLSGVCRLGEVAVIGSHTFIVPTPVFVDSWPADDGSTPSSIVAEAHVNAHSKGLQGSSQSPLHWGHTSTRVSVIHCGTTDEAAAVSAKCWMKYFALRHGAVLRAAVNLGYRRCAKVPLPRGATEDPDATSSSESESEPDLSDYSDDDEQPQ